MRIIKKNVNKFFIPMIAVCIICMFVLGTKVYASEEYAINMNMSELMQEINSMLKNSDDSMMSSNPYDYIKSEYFNNIVNRGIVALPVIVDEIETAENNGLREYILAIAAEEITNTNLNQENIYNWTNGKEWLEEWNIFLRNIPTRVNYIINDTENTMQVKEVSLKELGIMALPYIQEAIEEGHTEFEAVYNDIASLNTSDVQTYSLTQNIISESEIDLIKEMVEEVAVD